MTGTPDEQSTTRLVVALRTCSITPSGYLLRTPLGNCSRDPSRGGFVRLPTRIDHQKLRGTDRMTGMGGPDVRTDPFLGTVVHVVGHRQTRPNLPTNTDVTGCPFCPGGLEAPEPYDVRWFPNRWPAIWMAASGPVARACAAGKLDRPRAFLARTAGKALND